MSNTIVKSTSQKSILENYLIAIACVDDDENSSIIYQIYQLECLNEYREEQVHLNLLFSIVECIDVSEHIFYKHT